MKKVIDLSGLSQWAETMSGKRHPDVSSEWSDMMSRQINNKIKEDMRKKEEEKDQEEVIDLGRPRTEQDDEIRLLQLQIRGWEYKTRTLQRKLDSVGGGQCPYCQTPLVAGYLSPPLEAGSPERTWHISARCRKVMREKGFTEKRDFHPLEADAIEDLKEFAKLIQKRESLPWWNPRRWFIVLPAGLDRTIKTVVTAAEYE